MEARPPLVVPGESDERLPIVLELHGAGEGLDAARHVIMVACLTGMRLGLLAPAENSESALERAARFLRHDIAGDRAVYLPGEETAELWGRVRLTRGQNQFNGDRAIIKFKTGISRLLAGKGGKDKPPVRVLIVPNK